MTYELWYVPTLEAQNLLGCEHKLVRIYEACDKEEANYRASIMDYRLNSAYESYTIIGPV